MGEDQKGNDPREYLSVLLDDPSSAEPIRAALSGEEDISFLVWNRRGA